MISQQFIEYRFVAMTIPIISSHFPKIGSFLIALLFPDNHGILKIRNNYCFYKEHSNLTAQPFDRCYVKIIEFVEKNTQNFTSEKTKSQHGNIMQQTNTQIISQKKLYKKGCDPL